MLPEHLYCKQIVEEHMDVQVKRHSDIKILTITYKLTKRLKLSVHFNRVNYLGEQLKCKNRSAMSRISLTTKERQETCRRV